MRRLAALVALGLAACTSQPSLGSRFSGPTSLVAFRGFSRKDVAIRDYIAVASSRGDELRLLDPADLQPVLSPGAIFPLSIPTAPRPLLVASAALGDLDGSGNPLADALVAASAGGAVSSGEGPALQLIETWDATNRVAQSVPLPLAAGSEILCMTGVPARVASASLPAANARILVGASGGQLAIVEFTRATDGSGAVVPGTASVKSLGFDPVDIAVGPDHATVYIATPDAITTDSTLGAALNVFGVAQLGDATHDFSSVTAAKALAAGPRDPDAPATGNPRIGAGTVAVAIASPAVAGSTQSNVPERAVGTANTSSDTFSSFTSFVYAALDAGSCGTGKPIDCGIVTIDPASTLAADAGNLATDPAAAASTILTPDSGPAATLATAQRYRAPMPVPGTPLHLAIGIPPASGTQRITDSNNPGIPLLSYVVPWAANQSKNTGALAMVASSVGNVYWLDLSRWSPASDLAVTSGSSRVAVTSVTPAGVNGSYQLGLWLDADQLPLGSSLTPGAVQVDATGLPVAIDVWPGFTDADTWTIAYQNPLPFLSTRPGLFATSSAGRTYAALQSGTSAGSVVVATPIADPSLGVRVGDIVELPGVCEASVAAVLPENDTSTGFSFPGGAVQLALAASGAPVLPVCTAAQMPAAGASIATTLTIRASGMVLSNVKLGYLGRPGIGRTSDRNDGAFSVAWTATADGPASAASEARAVARKARRLFYPSDDPCPLRSPTSDEQALGNGCYGQGLKRLTDPLAPGPIIRFRVGVVGPNPSDVAALPVRGDAIVFVTQAGLSQAFRKPITGGAGAGGPIAFDRTALDPAGKVKAQFAGNQNDPTIFFEPYLDDQVMVFGTTTSSAGVTSVR